LKQFLNCSVIIHENIRGSIAGFGCVMSFIRDPPEEAVSRLPIRNLRV
jgi:hypothetical protein